MVRDKPLFGIGPDNFRWVYGTYLELDHWDTNIHANSIYFEFLADTGVIGLLVFLWLNWRWLRLSYKKLSEQSDRDQWVWQLALIASLLAWFAHGILDYFYEFAGTYILFWIIAGLAISLATDRANQGSNGIATVETV
jgi:O-antigen ligase